MDAGAIFDRFDVLLEQEREAILRIDAAALDAIALEKLALAEDLRGMDPSTQRDRLADLQRKLQRQTVLLSHARACIQDAVRTLAPPSGCYGPSGRISPAPSTISIRG